jgi:hypothetical protein
MAVDIETLLVFIDHKDMIIHELCQNLVKPEVNPLLLCGHKAQHPCCIRGFLSGYLIS